MSQNNRRYLSWYTGFCDGAFQTHLWRSWPGPPTSTMKKTRCQTWPGGDEAKKNFLLQLEKQIPVAVGELLKKNLPDRCGKASGWNFKKVHSILHKVSKIVLWGNSDNTSCQGAAHAHVEHSRFCVIATSMWPARLEFATPLCLPCQCWTATCCSCSFQWDTCV